MSIPTVATSTSIEALVGDIVGEFTQRLHRGERPSIEDVVKTEVEKHPEIDPRLLRQLLLTAMQMQSMGAPEPEDPLIGTTLGDFCVIGKIGSGGMGIVYEAEQRSLDHRKVALKILPLASALNPRSLQRFNNEMNLAARLKHEHIVPVYTRGFERGYHFYTMQFIEGQSLAAIIAELRQVSDQDPEDPKETRSEGDRTGPYAHPPGTILDSGPDTASLAAMTTKGTTRSRDYFANVARLGFEAAMGLEHAHQNCVVHRDIKPANLLVDGRGNLWIADFGLAQIQSNIQKTTSGVLVGTYRYMSPEQAMANRVPVDHRTDIYSLGATLYELLTLKPVVAGNDTKEMLRQIMFCDPQKPKELNPDIPYDLETIVLKALARAPAHRYASAMSLAADLRHFLNNEPIEGQREGWSRWIVRKSRRHATRITIGLLAAISAMVFSLFLLHLNKPSLEEMEKQRQEQALAALTQDRDRNEKVTLIGERGLPGYFQWVSDNNPGKILSTPNGEFSVQSWEYALVELLPDPRQERYRFRAEVRHERQADQESRVGIYFFHSQNQHNGAGAHFHCNVAFNDLVDLGEAHPNGVATGNSAGIQIHRQSRMGLSNDKTFVNNAEAIFRPARPVGALGPWRKIAVEVRPQTVRLFWESNRVADVTRETLLMKARRLIAKPDQPLHANSPKFEPRGGLGLYVSLGVASFRNVVVEPLGDEN